VFNGDEVAGLDRARRMAGTQVLERVALRMTTVTPIVFIVVKACPLEPSPRQSPLETRSRRRQRGYARSLGRDLVE
jgi:hypothetical protein